jgi:hypothetical protein
VVYRGDGNLGIRFFCFESHEQFFSYLATVTITGERAANLDLCLALTAFSSEGFYVPHLLPHGASVFKVISERFSLLNAVLLAKEQTLPILNVLGLTRSVQA